MTENDFYMKVRLRCHNKYKGMNDSFFGLIFVNGISEPCPLVKAFNAVMTWYEEIEIITVDEPYFVITKDHIGNLIYTPDKINTEQKSISQIKKDIKEGKIKTIKEIIKDEPKEEKTKSLDDIIEEANKSLKPKQKGRPRKKVKKE